MSNSDVTNPGSVDVADEGFGIGPISPNQPVTVSPSSSAGSATPAVAGGGLGGNTVTNTNPGTVNVANETFGVGLARNVNIH
jgi:hypothetical protein